MTNNETPKRNKKQRDMRFRRKNRRFKQQKSTNQKEKPEQQQKQQQQKQQQKSPEKKQKPKKHVQPRRRNTLAAKKRQKVYCPICNKLIQNIFFTFPDPKTGDKAHFDCILKEVQNYHPTQKGQKIYYLGGGEFGVVKENRSHNKFDLVIQDRFVYPPKTNERSK